MIWFQFLHFTNRKLRPREKKRSFQDHSTCWKLAHKSHLTFPLPAVTSSTVFHRAEHCVFRHPLFIRGHQIHLVVLMRGYHQYDSTPDLGSTESESVCPCYLGWMSGPTRFSPSSPYAEIPWPWLTIVRRGWGSCGSTAWYSVKNFYFIFLASVFSPRWLPIFATA
jgi:hypothetical protein